MAELFILIILVALVVLAIRRGKPVVLDNPLIIQRPGLCHMTLAPQLERAQAFIEKIAERFAESHQAEGDIPTQYFEVHDPNVSIQGGSYYLLAAASRGGMLYFQAINLQPLLRDADSHIKSLREFSEAVFVLHPLSERIDGQGAGKLRDAAESAAQQLQVGVKSLQETA